MPLPLPVVLEEISMNEPYPFKAKTWTLELIKDSQISLWKLNLE